LVHIKGVVVNQVQAEQGKRGMFPTLKCLGSHLYTEGLRQTVSAGYPWRAEPIPGTSRLLEGELVMKSRALAGPGMPKVGGIQ